MVRYYHGIVDNIYGTYHGDPSEIVARKPIGFTFTEWLTNGYYMLNVSYYIQNPLCYMFYLFCWVSVCYIRLLKNPLVTIKKNIVSIDGYYLVAHPT